MEACNGHHSCLFSRRPEVGTRILLLATKVVRLYGCFTPDDRIGVDFLFQLSCDSFPRSTLLSRYIRMLEPHLRSLALKSCAELCCALTTATSYQRALARRLKNQGLRRKLYRTIDQGSSQPVRWECLPEMTACACFTIRNEKIPFH